MLFLAPAKFKLFALFLVSFNARECGALPQKALKLKIALHRKWSFPLRISSVNVTKSAGSCGFGHIYWRNP